MKRKNNQAGFTLIELMIVIAIIGILMAYAIPAYRDYTVRSNRGECNAIADGMKTPMAEYYYKWGTWPATMTAIDFTGNVTGAHVTGVVTAGGVVTCTVDAAAGGGDVVWTAAYANGDLAVRWSCGGEGALPAAQQVCPN